MTLTENGRIWIANHLGSGTPKCFVSSGIQYTDPSGVIQTGSTQDVVASMKMSNDTIGPGGERYQHPTDTSLSLFDNNDYNLLDDDDVKDIGDNDGSPAGEDQYCYTEDTGCTVGVQRCRTSTVIEECKAGTPNYWEDVQTCGTGFTCQGGVCVEEAARPVTGPLQVYVGGGESCDPAVEGDPSVTLDTSEAFAYFKAEPITYVGVMDILVQNLSDRCFAYFAWEMSMWDGIAGETCPITIPERKQITRYLGEVSDKKIISVTRTNASENKMIGGSFEIPATLEGIKTICLSLWGNFNKQALLDELAVAGYEEEIDW